MCRLGQGKGFKLGNHSRKQLQSCGAEIVIPRITTKQLVREYHVGVATRVVGTS